MAISRIFLWLGCSLLMIAALMFLTAMAGFFVGEIRYAQTFFMVSCFMAALGTIVYFTAQNAPNHESTRDALLFLFLFWVIVPIASALPYLSVPMSMSNIVGPDSITVVGESAKTTKINIGIAYFEAVSALTTTGASTLQADLLPKTILIWRSLLQWCGGVFAAIFAVVILAAVNLSGTGVHKSVLFTLKRGELFSQFIRIGRVIALVYALVSAACFVLLVVFGTPSFEALCLSLSAVATGGLTPRDGILAPYVSHMGGVVLALTCLFGACNVALLWDILRRRSLNAVREFFSNVEHRGLLGIASIFLLLGFGYVGYRHLYTLVVEAAFMASTAGFDYHVIGVDILPPSILIALALIGGSALSTAGGLKIIRFLLLFHHMRTDLDRMSHPSRVMPVRFQGNIIEDKAFLSIWMYFFAYSLVFALGIAALGASGLSFTHAVTISASALSNTGPLLDATYPEISYANLNVMGLAIVDAMMLIGRIEVLAAFAIVSPSLWRK